MRGADRARVSRVIGTLGAPGVKRPARPSLPHRLAAPTPPFRPASACRPRGLTISFTSPEDLLGRVMGLAQSAAGDFAAFAAGLTQETDRGPAQEPPRTQGAVMAEEKSAQLSISLPRYDGPLTCS